MYSSKNPKTGGVKYNAVTGSKGYRWLESEVVKTGSKDDCIDRAFFDAMVDDAVSAIRQWGDIEWFISEDPYDSNHNGILPF